MALVLRLGDILEELRLKERLSFNQLSKDIRDAYKGLTGQDGKLDRRKLKRILHSPKEGNESLSLSIQELEELDAYLAPQGRGLDRREAIFSREGLLHTLAQKKVVFFLGARPREEPKPRHDLSVWDVHALNTLLSGISGLGRNVRFELEPIIRHTTALTKRKDQLSRRVTKLSKTGSSLCCVGSPRACLLAEVMLAKMLGVGDEAFRVPKKASKPVPFSFVWTPRDDFGRPWHANSRFAMPLDQLPDRELRRDVEHGRAWAIQVYEGGKPILKTLRWSGHLSKDYGVIVAQRWSKDSTWLVCTGLSGPGTRAAAEQLVEKLELKSIPDVPERERGKPPTVWYAVVEADVEVKTIGDPGDRRKIVRAKVIVGPEHWSPGK